MTDNCVIKCFERWLKKLGEMEFFSLNYIESLRLYTAMRNIQILCHNQKEEIERLKTLNSKLETEVFMQRENGAIHTEAEDENWFAPLKTIDEIKAEAIKEFAERLKTRIFMLSFHPNGHPHFVSIDVTPAHIDNLVKEMVGDAK